MGKKVDTPKSNGSVLNWYHHDYLYWIYPLFILGIIIFTVRRDKQIREPSGLSGTSNAPDSSIKMLTRADSLKLEEYNDSIPILFFTINK